MVHLIGNYIGPWWSGGKLQSSIDGTKDENFLTDSKLRPVDVCDTCAMMHDALIANYGQQDYIDDYFIDCAQRAGGRCSLAANLVRLDKTRRRGQNLRGLIIMAKTKNNNIAKGNARVPKGQGGPKSSTQLLIGGPKLNTTRSGNDVMRAAPAAFSTRRQGIAPKITRMGAGVTVTHRTLLGPVTASGSFSATSYSVNPGLAGTFPWLSDLASKYEEYKFTSLRFEYRSVTATSTPGVCFMSFDYDAADSIPTTKLAQSQTIPNAENNVWMNNDLVVPCDSIYKFVRQGTVTGTDIKTYDWGNMVLSTIYGDGTITGELYIEYTVHLRKPSLGQSLSGLASYTSTIAAPLNALSTSTGLQITSKLSTLTLRLDVSGEFYMELLATGTVITAVGVPTIDYGTVALVVPTVINAAPLSLSKRIGFVGMLAQCLIFQALLLVQP